MKKLIKKIKFNYNSYKLGKHILNHLPIIDNFKCGIMRKTSIYLEKYSGTLHTLDYMFEKRGKTYWKVFDFFVYNSEEDQLKKIKTHKIYK